MRVVDLLRQGKAAPWYVSALDAVMGRDWALVDAGRPRRHRPVDAGLDLTTAHRRNLDRIGQGGLPGRKPQAVVKMIRNGGAADIRGLRAQMAYLSRDGTTPMQRSEATLGVEIDADQAAQIERSWRMPPEGSGRADRTSHFIASFPEDIPHAAAERAGRAWAEEMFGSGTYGGDSYDYYTAFHTDRAHPHMHVVVYRRGLENGEWLKVSERSDMNYDAMRSVLVDVAGREGIELEATPRLARGLHDRPVPDAEYRRAGEQGRVPVAPDHTRETAILAAAALLHQSRRFATEAQLIEGRAPEIAEVLYAASAAASTGRALAEITTRLTDRQEAVMNDRVQMAKTEIRENIEKMDRGVAQVGDNATRMKLAREIADLKAETAPLLGNARDLASFTEPGESGRYRGMGAADTPHDVARKAMADDQVGVVAARYGVDPDATVERYSGAAPSKGLERQFERAELEERGRSRGARGDDPETVEERQQALSRMHREIAEIYGAARARGRSAEEPQHAASGAVETPEPTRPPRPARPSPEHDPLNQRILADQAAEKRAEPQRDEAKRQQDRADAERSRRERDDGRDR